MNWKHERYCESFMHGNGDESFWDYFSVTDQDENEVAKVDDEKNANLIAAAPELLEALQYLTHALGYGSSMDVAKGKELAELAINKALGEKQ